MYVSVFFGIPPSLSPVSLACLPAYVDDVLQDVALYVSEVQGGRSWSWSRTRSWSWSRTRGSHCAFTDRWVLISGV